jgi:lipopolysaccharide/colanic/teichoic acid biosynthesis glycosyltransferase
VKHFTGHQPERALALYTEVTELRTHVNAAPVKPERGSPKRPTAKPNVAAPVAPARYRWYPPCKVALERVAALGLLVLLGPLVLGLALLVRLTSRGPAFYRQTRLGKGGALFTIYKLRTMVDRCESLTGPRWSLPGDPRVTGLGRFLR